MASIEELLPEAIRRCGELSGEIRRGEEIVARAVSRAQALGAAVASHSGEMHRHLQGLAARLADASRELQEDGLDARSRLEGLARRSGEVRERVEDLAPAPLTVAELRAPGQRHDPEAVIDAGVVRASAALGAFRAALGQARQEWRHRQDEVTEELARAEEAARGQTRAYVSGIEGSFNDAIDALVAELPHDLLIEPHNQAVAGLMQKLTEEAKGQLGEALGPVRQALEELGRTCRGEQDRLQQGTGEILKRAEAARQRLEKMRPAWALAHRLG
jgi:hypothetical protein